MATEYKIMRSVNSEIVALLEAPEPANLTFDSQILAS